MAAISRSKVKIWIVDADTVPSTLLNVASTDVNHKGYIAGEIKSYSKSGGEKDTESDPVFGGYIDKEKPISQVELSLDIVPLIDSVGIADRWDAMTYTKEVIGGNNIYTMATDNLSGTTLVSPNDKAVFIQANEGSVFKSIAFNNCNVTTLDSEHNADDNRTYTMNLKFSPTNARGRSNFMTAGLAATALPNWTSLVNN